MGRKHKHLYEQIISPANLRTAYLKASNGKRASHGYLAFREHAELNLANIHTELADKTWQQRELRQFIVHEPKVRLIGAPTFRDRVVHHALCNIIEPIFDATFLPTSFACRRGKGTHAGVKWVQAQMRSKCYTHYLKTDFASYFASIDRATLHEQYRKKVTCKDTRWLLEQITPTAGVGLPIGALTSQLGANVYGNVIDHELHHVLRVPFARYMDDIIVLGYDQASLREVKDHIERVAAQKLGLQLSRWNTAPTSRGINFLGYRIWATHKLLRKDSVTRAKSKIKRYTHDGDDKSLRDFLAAWKGYTSWADAHNLNAWLANRYNMEVSKPPRLTRQQLLKDLLGETS